MASTIRRVVFSVLLVLFISILTHRALKVSQVFGIFNLRHNHAPGPCRIVKGTETGSEDIELLPDGFAFISTGLSWPYMPYNSSLRVGIYGFDFKTPNEDLLWIPLQGNFNQEDIRGYHGISAWKDEINGDVTLFATTHGHDKETVELFHYDAEEKVLKHKRTIADPLLSSLNDVVATGPDSFYVTNDGCWRLPSSRLRLAVVELLLSWKCASIVYYDGKSARIVGDGYANANGINLSPDGRTIYVSMLGDLEVAVFKRHHDNNIQELRRIPVAFRPDNINIDRETGDLLLAGSYHMGDLSVSPPVGSTHVVRIKVNDGDIIDELYSNQGDQLSMGSAASRYGNHLLIGSVHHKVLLCELKSLTD